MKRICTMVAGLLLAVTWLPAVSAAQELHNDDRGVWRAEVVEVLAAEVRLIPGTDTEQTYQTINAELLEGPESGKVVTIENDYLVLEVGDLFYANHAVFIDGSESYGVIGIDRLHSMLWLIAVFVGVIVLFGGWQGVRSLTALLASFLVIIYVLMPGILSGWNPLVASVLVASGILFAAIFFTHGFNRESAVAYAGTMIAVALSGIFAIGAVHFTSLTGFAAEASTYLNFNTGGSIDFTALLLGAIIIGVLGVLDDISVTQAAVVTELYNSNKTLPRKEVYLKAMRVGREHVGALVNTLVLAYTGASLPLLLQFYLSSPSLASAINTELIATEIVRTIVGSLGLIMAVPIVTALAVVYLKDYVPKHPHSHSHGHSH